MKVKVLELLTSFQIGGTERQVANLVRGLDSSRFDLRVACLRRFGELLGEIESLHVPVTEFRIGGKLYGPKTALEAMRLAQYLRRNRVQIVHTFGLYPNIFAVPVAKMAGVPIVLASIRDQGDILTPLQQRIQRWSCRFADCILVNATAIRERLVEQGYDESRIVVIRNGIRPAHHNRSQDSAEARERWGVPRRARLVVVLSRLNPMKGIEYFLDAAGILAARYPDTHFVVAGDGEIRASLQERARNLGIADRVTFTGFRTDIPDLLAEASVSVLPSLSEGLSNTVLESMGAGIPVVATRVGGNPEVVEDGVSGFLVPPRDAGALAQAAGRLLADEPLARRIGQAGMERVARRFSVENSVRQTERIYRQLLAVSV
jgi:glycosyltransferase involved in cell wall biosynthesis